MPALLELVPYVVALVCLALAFIITALVLGLLQWLVTLLNKLPGINIGTGWIHTVSAAVTHALGAAFNDANSLVGGSFHKIAEAFDWAWRELKGWALVIAESATILGAVVAAYHAIRALVHALEKGGKGVAGKIRTLEREFHGIEGRVKALEKDWTKGIGHDLIISEKALEQAWHSFDTRVLPGIESGVEAIPADLQGIRTWAEKNFVANTRSALIAAVAVGLAALGLGGLRCSSLLNSLKNRGCGLWNGLESLLGLFIDTLLIADLCAIIPEAVKFFGVVEGALTGLISQAANAICAVSNPHWTNPNVAPGPTPPAQVFDPTTLAAGG